MEKSMHYYVNEYHSYARCFSFICKFEDKYNRVPAICSMVDSQEGVVENSWVEIRIENGNLIFAGSCLVPPFLHFKDISLQILFTNNEQSILQFPEPNYIDASIIAATVASNELRVLHWAKDRISESTADVLSPNQVQITSLPSGQQFFETKFDNLNGSQLRLHTNPPQSLPVITDISVLFGDISDSRILDFEDIHKDEEAWIIGNGPSVKLEQLNQLRGKTTFAFNRFHKAYANTDFRPTYLLSGDSQMISDFGDQMTNESECVVFLANLTRPEVSGDFIWLKQINIFPSIFSLTPQTFVTPGGNSPYVAMQLAAFMGIKRLFLYGFDFSYKMQPVIENEPTIKVSGDNNHFIPNYRNGRQWFPPSFRNIAHSFWNARLYFESIGGEIINCTPGSSLEIFEKRDILS